MLDRKSIYSLNKKDPEAIVCTNADGKLIRLTREDFDTEEDFQKWKAWSDSDYHDEENREHIEANHRAFEYSELSESLAVDGPEVIIEERIDRRARERYTAETVIRIKEQLTEKQFRRLWMYCVNRMTEQQIADYERVGQRRISTSITAAAKKIKKFFSLMPEK